MKKEKSLDAGTLNFLGCISEEQEIKESLYCIKLLYS